MQVLSLNARDLGILVPWSPASAPRLVIGRARVPRQEAADLRQPQAARSGIRA